MNVEWTAWDRTYMLSSLCRAHTVILSLGDTCARNNSDNIAVDSSLGMKTFNLKFIELDKELFDELIKYIVAFTHKLGGLFFGHLAGLVHLRLLKVRKYKYEYFLGIARYLHKVYGPASAAPVIWDLMEVTIQYLPLLRHSLFVVANVHRWGALCGHQIKGTLLGRVLLMEGVGCQLWHYLGWVCCHLGVVRGA